MLVHTRLRRSGFLLPQNTIAEDPRMARPTTHSICIRVSGSRQMRNTIPRFHSLTLV
jgi:hypothetical protein